MLWVYCAGRTLSYTSECSVGLTTSVAEIAPPPQLGSSVARSVIRPVAVKLPLRTVSDRMNTDAGVEWPSRRRPVKASGDDPGTGDLSRFPVNENVAGETERWYDGDAHSNSDDEVCDVFSHARRLHAAAGWWSCDVIDGRCYLRMLRALTDGGAGVARSTRWTGLPRRTSSVMNAVELPRPFLDFAKMQVSIDTYTCTNI